MLVDARDTDPGEHVLLEPSSVSRCAVDALCAGVTPDGEIYLHVDVDVADPTDVPGLFYPAPGGPSLDAVIAAVARIAATGRLAAVGVAATWRHEGAKAEAHADIVRRLVDAVETASAAS